MPPEPAAKSAPPKTATQPLSATTAPAVVPPVAAPAGGGAAAPDAKKPVARVEKSPENPASEKPAAAAPKGPGRLEIAVAPWGDVLVDGKKRGRTPPLLVIDVPAGAHTIEIRNATSPAHTARVEVKPGETVRIQHRFR